MLSPIAGQQFPGGSTVSISWTASDDEGLGDILSELGHVNETIRENYEQLTLETMREAEPRLNDDERAILEALSVEGIDLERVCGQTSLPPERISSALTMLQLKGVVEQLPGNRFAKIRA